MKAVLVFACNLLGDSICRLPAVKAAGEAYAGSRVSVVADPRYADVFEGQPYIDTVRVLPRGGGWLAQARSWASLMLWARREGPDLVLDLYGSKRTALASRLSGARWRAGLHHDGAARWYNLRPAARSDAPQGHIIQMVNASVVAAGVRAPFAYCPLAVGDRDRAAAGELLRGLGLGDTHQLILLNPAARVRSKRWPAERFGGLAAALARDRTVRCMVVTSPDGAPVTDAVVAESDGVAAPLPSLPLKALAAVVERARLLVTGDTGMLHIGSAMGTPAVVLSGPTDPSLAVHPDLPHASLFHRGACEDWTAGVECPSCNTCAKATCIRAISVEEALGAVRDLLHTSDRARRPRDLPASP